MTTFYLRQGAALLTVCLPLAGGVGAAEPAAQGPAVKGPVAQVPAEPAVVGTFPENEADVVRLPDGTLKVFYNRRGEYVGSITSRDDGRTWSEPVKEFAISGETAHAIQVLSDRYGELQVYYLAIRRGGRKIAVDLFLDLWICTTSEGRTKWTEPRLAVAGAIGALRGIVQTKTGRIVVPFSTADPTKKPGPPVGYFYTTAVYSDDDGATWKQSPSRLTAPCYEGYNGGNYGAVEPTIVALNDGRLWMLIRTQTGKMYESFSKDGAEWSDAVESKFYGSNSPAMFRRLDDGRLFLAWNNAQVAPKVEGQGVYSGRDALHAAVSADDGKTWRGLREVYRDPTRHGEGLELRNDRGTAYPDAVQTAEGAIVLVTGQGEGRRAIVRFDPAWITATHGEDDFSRGLEGWHAFEEFGPVTRFFRARRAVGKIVPHPEDPKRQVLQLAPKPKPASPAKTVELSAKMPPFLPPAGTPPVKPRVEPIAATWNFPAGRRGTLTLRVRADGEKTWRSGVTLALADRLVSPTDPRPYADQLCEFYLTDEESATLTSAKWHEVRLRWDLARNEFEAEIDGMRLSTTYTISLPRFHFGTFGPSYLLVRHAGEPGTPAILIERVSVDVQP
jgi:hypothetical protein